MKFRRGLELPMPFDEQCCLVAKLNNRGVSPHNIAHRLGIGLRLLHVIKPELRRYTQHGKNRKAPPAEHLSRIPNFYPTPLVPKPLVLEKPKKSPPRPIVSVLPAERDPIKKNYGRLIKTMTYAA